MTREATIYYMWLALMLAWSAAGQAEERDFDVLFNGQDLAGWHAFPEETAGDWSVRDGVIVGTGSANRLSYLVYKDHKLADFELRFSYRMRTDGNTGVEIRARRDTTGKRPFEGYHADFGHVGIGPNVLGAWDFHFATRREHPCPRGTRLVIAPDETGSSRPIKDAVTLQDIRKRDWNDVRVVARQNHCRFYLNGKLSSEFTDNAKAGRLTHGAVALQLHDRGMVVEFKDVKLKRLGD